MRSYSVRLRVGEYGFGGEFFLGFFFSFLMFGGFTSRGGGGGG